MAKTTTFEECKEKRIEIAAKPGTLVMQPTALVTRDWMSYIRIIDRGVGKLQGQVFQPNVDKAIIETAGKIIETLNDAIKDSAKKIAELADVKFYEPQTESQAKEKGKDKNNAAGDKHDKD